MIDGLCRSSFGTRPKKAALQDDASTSCACEETGTCPSLLSGAAPTRQATRIGIDRIIDLHPGESRHETPHYPSSSGRKLHRHEHDRSKRGGLRSRCVSRRLRRRRQDRLRCTTCCPSGCPCCRCRATAARCSPETGLITCDASAHMPAH